MPMTKEFDVAKAVHELETANMLISYSGYISDQSLEGIAQGIKAVFETGAYQTKKSRKIFSIFVESSQNIIFYSGRRMEIDGTRDGAGYGAIFIQALDDGAFSVISLPKAAALAATAAVSHSSHARVVSAAALSAV